MFELLVGLLLSVPPAFSPAVPNQPPGSSFSVSNPLTEYFPTAVTPSGNPTTESPTSSNGLTWTVTTDNYAAGKTAVTWFTGSSPQTYPGFQCFNYGHGAASTPWTVGTGSFDLRFDTMVTTAVVANLAASANGHVLQYGCQIGVSTQAATSLTWQSITVQWSIQFNGFRASVIQGIPNFEEGWLNGYNPGTNVITSTSGDTLQTGAYVYLPWANNCAASPTGTCWWQVASSTSFVCTAGTNCPVHSGGNYSEIPYSGSVELSNFNVPYVWNSVRTGTLPAEPAGSTQALSPNGYPVWPLSSSISGPAGLPLNAPMTGEITVDTHNNATFNLYSQEYIQGGMNPYASPILTFSCSLTPGGTCGIPSASSTPSFASLNILNLNGDHGGWTSGVTTGGSGANAPSTGGSINVAVSDIRGYGAVTGTLPTVTGILPSGASTTFAAGTTATITGANLTAGSTVRVERGIVFGVPQTTVESSLASTVSTTGSGSSLTFTLPSGLTSCTPDFATHGTPCPTHRIEVIDPSGIEIPIQSVTPWQQIYTGIASQSTAQINWPVQPPGIILLSSATVLGVEPTDAVAGDRARIYGEGFSGTTVTMGGSTCTSPAVISPIEVDCTVPSGSPTIGGSTLATSSPTFTSASKPFFKFGFSGHPLFMSSANLTALQSAFASAIGGGACSSWTPSSVCLYDYAYPLQADVTAAPAPGSTFNPADFGGITSPPGQDPMWFVGGRIQPVNYFPDYIIHAVANTATTPGDLTTAPQLNNWLGQFGFSYPQSINASNLQLPIDVTYDLLMVAPTTLDSTAVPTNRIRWLRDIQFHESFCNAFWANGDPFFRGNDTTFGSGTYNHMAINDSTCALSALAQLDTEANACGTITSNTCASTSNIEQFLATVAYYYITEYFSDGAPVEGGQYSQYGKAPSLWLAQALQSSSLTGSAAILTGSGVPLVQIATWAADSYPAGQTFDTTGIVSGCSDPATWTYADTEPQHYSAVQIPWIYQNVTGVSSLSNAGNLLWVADCEMHQISQGHYYTGYLEQQAQGGGGAAGVLLGLLGRWESSSTPASFSGWSMMNGSSSLASGPTINGNAYNTFSGSNQIIMKSDSTQTQPDISLMFTGKINSTLNHNEHHDIGSFTLSALGDPILIDPGYNESSAAAHSTTQIGSTDNTVSTNAGVVTAVQAVANATGSTAYTRQGVTMKLTGAYSGFTGTYYRTIATYQGNSTASPAYQGRAVIILDDLSPSGGAATAITTRFQTIKSTASSTGCVSSVNSDWCLTGGVGGTTEQILTWGYTPSLGSAANNFTSTTNITSASGSTASVCLSGSPSGGATMASLVGYRVGNANIPAATYIIASPGTCATGQAQLSQAPTGTVSGTVYAQNGLSWVFDALMNGYQNAGYAGYNGWTWLTLTAGWTSGTNNATPLVTVILIGNSGGIYESAAPTVTITPSTSVSIVFASGGTVSFSYSGGLWVLN